MDPADRVRRRLEERYISCCTRLGAPIGSDHTTDDDAWRGRLPLQRGPEGRGAGRRAVIAGRRRRLHGRQGPRKDGGGEGRQVHHPGASSSYIRCVITPAPN